MSTRPEATRTAIRRRRSNGSKECNAASLIFSPLSCTHLTPSCKNVNEETTGKKLQQILQIGTTGRNVSVTSSAGGIRQLFGTEHMVQQRCCSTAIGELYRGAEERSSIILDRKYHEVYRSQDYDDLSASECGQVHFDNSSDSNTTRSSGSDADDTTERFGEGIDEDEQRGRSCAAHAFSRPTNIVQAAEYDGKIDMQDRISNSIKTRRDHQHGRFHDPLGETQRGFVNVSHQIPKENEKLGGSTEFSTLLISGQIGDSGRELPDESGENEQGKPIRGPKSLFTPGANIQADQSELFRTFYKKGSGNVVDGFGGRKKNQSGVSSHGVETPLGDGLSFSGCHKRIPHDQCQSKGLGGGRLERSGRGDVQEDTILKDKMKWKSQWMKPVDKKIMMGRFPPSEDAKYWNQLSDVEKGLPLHVPKRATSVNWIRIRELFPQLEQEFRWIFDPSVYPDPCMARAKVQVVPKHHLEALLEKEVWRRLLPGEVPRHYVVYKLRVEKEKNRLRPLQWPKYLNEVMYEANPHTQIPDILSFEPQANDGLFCLSFDQSCSFYQYELDASVSMNFCVMTEWGIFCVRKVSMGFTRSTATLHSLQSELQKQVQKTIYPLKIRCYPYVDNAKFSGTYEAVCVAGDTYKDLCRECNIQLNAEENNIPANEQTYVGVCWNHAELTRRLSEKFVTKLKHLEICSQMSLADARKIFGLLFFGSRVLRHSLVGHFYEIKFYRHLSSSTNEHEKQSCPVKKQLEDWRDFLIQNRKTECRTSMEPKDLDCVIYTDASNWGFGHMFFAEGQLISYHCSAWNRKQMGLDINAKELYTPARAIVRYKKLILQSNGTALLMDNKAAIAAIVNGTCASQTLAKQLFHFTKQISAGNLVNKLRLIAYVKTEDNLADNCSRGKEMPSATAKLPYVKGKGYISLVVEYQQVCDSKL